MNLQKDLSAPAAQMDPRLYHAWRCAALLDDVMLQFYGGEVGHQFVEAEHDPKAKLSLEEDPAAIKLDVDKWTDRLARQYLTTLYPDYGFVGEESFEDRGDEFDGPLTWIVDPVCGSMGYFRKTGSFGTSVALVDREQGPILGVLNCPALNLAAVGSALEGRVEFWGRFRDPAPGVNLVMSSNREKDPVNQAFVRALNPARAEFMEGIPPKAVQTLAGVYDLLVTLPQDMDGTKCKIWDYAATGALAKALGMTLINARGGELDLSGASGWLFTDGLVLAKNRALAEKTLETIALMKY